MYILRRKKKTENNKKLIGNNNNLHIKLTLVQMNLKTYKKKGEYNNFKPTTF